MKVNKAIILAAGRGQRLRPRTDSTHKSLTVIKGKPLLERLLDQLTKCGIKKVVMVVGYLAGSIRDSIGTSYGGIRIEYRENKDYLTTNNIVSLQKAGEDLDEGVLLFECDLILEDAIVSEIASDSYEDIMVLDSFNENMNGTVVGLDEKDIVTGMYLKKEQGEDFNPYNYYKTVNIYRFSKRTATDLAKRLEEYISLHGVDDYYEAVIKDMVASGNYSFKGMRTGGRLWAEIDDEKDLEYASGLFE
jgi:choline kinase